MDANTLTLVGAIITGFMTLVGVIINARVQSEKQKLENDKRDQRTDDRLSSIEKKLDIHNGYAEKFGEIEKSIVSIRKDIEYIKAK